MMMATSWSLLLTLFIGGGVGVPLGLPPLPEDPALAAVAPGKCVWYFSWSGVKTPDAKSKNQTEQLLAEPEVKQFCDSVGAAFSDAIKRGAPPTPQGKLLGEQGPKLIYALVTHPTAIFIESVEQGGAITGGAVVNLGGEAAGIEKQLVQIEDAVLAGAAKKIGSWHTIAPAAPGPSFVWGFHGKYLVVGVGAAKDGAASAEGIVKRLAGKPPEWLAALRKRLPVEQPSTVSYLDLKQTIAIAKLFVPDADAAGLLDALGISKAEVIGAVTGLDGAGCVSKVWIKIDPDTKGIPAIFAGEPLTAVDLQAIPRDSSCAVVGRLRIGSAMADLKLDGGPLDFPFGRQFLSAVGDTWSLYNCPSEGGLIFTGLTAVAPVKDRAQLVKLSDELAASHKPPDTPQPRNFFGGGTTFIRQSKFQGQTIYFATVTGGFLNSPFAPAWAITDKQLIVALSPQSIRAYLSRSAKASTLADVPQVAVALKSAGRPVLITYQDTGATLKILYPLLEVVFTLFSDSMEQGGIAIDPSMMPSLAAILPHVEPSVGVLSREKDGFLYVSRQTLPGAGLTSTLLPLGFFWFADVKAEPTVDPQIEIKSLEKTQPESDQPKLEKPEIEKPQLERPQIERPVVEKPQPPDLERPTLKKPDIEKAPLDRPTGRKP